jgi:hypothetical protein
VHKLVEGVLYRPNSHQFAVGEHVFVDHTNKKVYYFQATVSLLRNHLFNTSTVRRVIDGLRLLSSDGEGYKVVIVGVNDMSLNNPTGIGFIYNKITVSLLEWQNQDEDKQYSSRVETVIARARFFSVLDSFALTNRETEIERNTTTQRDIQPPRREQMLPSGWKYPPNIPVKVMWDLWHFGDKGQNVTALKCLIPSDLEGTDRMKHSRVKCTVKAIELKCAGLMPPGKSTVSQLSLEENNVVFDKALNALFAEIYSTSRPNPSELSCAAIYEQLRQKQISST